MANTGGTGDLALLAAPPVPRAEPLRSLGIHLAHASAQGGSPTPQSDRHTSDRGSCELGDRLHALSLTTARWTGFLASPRARAHAPSHTQLHKRERENVLTSKTLSYDATHSATVPGAMPRAQKQPTESWPGLGEEKVLSPSPHAPGGGDGAHSPTRRPPWPHRP